MTVVARLEPAALDPQAELRALIAESPGAGAVVSFVGLARSRSSDGREIERLQLDHHPVLTAKSLSAIAADALSRFAVTNARVVHRCGSIAPGEPIVFAGAAASHRRAAFEAADYLMDRLKTEAIFWKREDSGEMSTWVEPTDTDYADRGRWG